MACKYHYKRKGIEPCAAWGQKTEAARKLLDILVLIALWQEILGRRGLVLATDAGRHQRSHATGACRSRAKALR